MTNHQDNPTNEVSDFLERTNMRASLLYIKLLQEDTTECEALINSDATAEHKKAAFQRLMTLTLGSTKSWSRLYKLAQGLGIGPGTLQRYVYRTSAPVPVLFPIITEHLKSLLAVEYSQIEEILEKLDAAAQEKHAVRVQKWKVFEERVYNPLPGSDLNCQVSYVSSSSETTTLPLQLMFSYPCRGIYELTRLFPHVCAICEKSGKEEAYTHGRVILASEDGFLLLPHIIRSQADLLQTVEDLRESDTVRPSFILEKDSRWYDDCKEFLSSHPLIVGLPQGHPSDTTARDLTKDKMVWCM